MRSTSLGILGNFGKAVLAGTEGNMKIEFNIKIEEECQSGTLWKEGLVTIEADILIIESLLELLKNIPSVEIS